MNKLKSGALPIVLLVANVLTVNIGMAESAQLNANQTTLSSINSADMSQQQKIEQLKAQAEQFAAKGQFSKAIQRYQALSIEEPDEMAHQVKLVRHLMIVNRKNKAKQQLKKMQAVAPNDSGVLIASGEMAMLENKTKQALDYYQQATKEAPNDKKAWIGLANVFYKMQNIEQADEALAVFEELDKAKD